MEHEEYNDTVGRPSGALALWLIVIVASIVVVCSAIAVTHRKASARPAIPPITGTGIIITADAHGWKPLSPRDKWFADSGEFEVMALGVISDCKDADAATWKKMNCAVRLKRASEIGNKIQAEYLALPK